jgi:hypothetical protein
VIVRLCFKVAYRVVVWSFVFLKSGVRRWTQPVEKGWRTAVIVRFFENAGCACDADTVHLNAAGVAKKVDIRCEPASMITEGNPSQSILYRNRNAPADRTVPTDGWTLRDSHR